MNKTGIAITIVFLIAVLTLIAHLSTTTLEFSRYNHQWTGTSGFFSQLEEMDAREVSDLAGLAGADRSLLLIIAPDITFSPEEIAAIREFLNNGNILFIADETGMGNPLLAGIGSNITIHPGNLCSVDMQFADPHTVIATIVDSDALLEGVTAISTNRPAALEGGDLLMSTSYFSWMDADDDSRIGENESFSRYGIFARESIGNGELYVLSDPSIFINGMVDGRIGNDNNQFIRNLISTNSTVLIDQTHSATTRVDGVLVLVNYAKNTMTIKILVLIISLILIMALFSRRRG